MSLQHECYESMTAESIYPQMLRLAIMYVSSRAVADEVVQEAWVGVLKGISRFEGRSTLENQDALAGRRQRVRQRPAAGAGPDDGDVVVIIASHESVLLNADQSFGHVECYRRQDMATLLRRTTS